MSAPSSRPATTPADAPRRADARRNRERILRAARAAFAEEGAAVQMDAVASRAGVGVGTVYRHFPTKEALLGELTAESIRRCLREAERALAERPGWPALEHFFRFTARDMAADAGVREALGTLVPERRPAVDDSELLTRLADLAGPARAEGSLRPDVTVADLHAAVCGLSTAIRVGADPDIMADVLLRGLHSGGGAERDR